MKLLKSFAEFAIEYYPAQNEPSKDKGDWVTGDPTPDTAFVWDVKTSAEENLKDMNNQVERDRKL